jgi:hypothetical protein
MLAGGTLWKICGQGLTHLLQPITAMVHIVEGYTWFMPQTGRRAMETNPMSGAGILITVGLPGQRKLK